ncbi:major facilitator superfamily domain-containing protein [Rhexocercosporidium sp. MPI-PUGE-AT-0058]|nr:major facilitator superfamily domain-containing protein [Rhexocercosporidium sp. MPI-PUGE-AT-0058]
MTSTQTLPPSIELYPIPLLHSQGADFTRISVNNNNNNNVPISLADSPLVAEELTESPHILQETKQLSRRRATAVVTTVAGVNFLNTMGSGILTVALPTMAKDLGLGIGLLLWPASIYALTSGCTLLLAGSLADILGRRPTFLVGSTLYSFFTLGCGLSPSGTSLIIFRGLQGLSISLCLTTAVGIVSTSFPAEREGEGGKGGNRRNFAFAATGAASPVGYTVGLVLGGVFVQRVGWRCKWQRMRKEIDWVGAIIATGSISMLSYVLAVITSSASSIKSPQNISLLTVALLLIPTFILWMGRQERLGRPAIIPNSIWKQSAFTTTCVVVFLTWGAFNPFGYFTTLFFQEIQHLTPLSTSLRFLPTVVCGLLTNIATGLLVRKIPATYLVGISSAFSALACVLMAVVRPEWNYWVCAFWAVGLSPMSSDVLYTISNLIITSSFPPTKQSLAGGVFNTVSQIGNSVGLTVGAVIAASVSASTSSIASTSSSASFSFSKSGTGTPGQRGGGVGRGNGDDVTRMLDGYRATFYACFAAMIIVVGVGGWGLRGAGRVGGRKRE